jgi:hypothetical protein
LAGILKVDQVQSDSNLSFNIAGSNVAFMNATSLQMVGSNVSLAGTNVITNGKVVTAAQPTGAVLQVVQVVTNSTYSTNSTSPTATGFIGSITPTSASSKILISINGGQFRYSPSGGQEIHERLYRSIGGGGYSIIIGDLAEIVISPANSIMAIPHSLVYLDSPATTSSVSYQPYINSNAGPITTYFNLASVYVTMTLMEIAA